jgi:hypothetical protein
MASALTSPYKDDTLAEVVPNVVKIAGKLAQSSVITDRRRVRIVPQSGQTYTLGAGGTGVVNFLIQDGQAYADLQTANISFTVGLLAQDNTSTAILDDGAWSVFRRALVSVNSTQADDIDRVAVKANQEIYATCSQSWYDGPGSLMGLWKHSLNGFSATGAGALAADTPASKYNPRVKALREASASSNPAAQTAANVVSTRYSFPVSLLSHFFRSEMLYPCRNAGQLYLQLQLASAAEAAFHFTTANGQTATGAPTITISDITLEMDYVSLHPSYVEMMDKLMADPAEDGVMWAYDAHTVGSAQLNSAGGDQSAVFTKASQNLRSIHVVAQPTGAPSSVNYGPQSTFVNPGCVNIQTRAGSLYFPAFQSIGNARMAMDLFESYGSPAAVDKASIVDALNYNEYSPVAASGAAPTIYLIGVNGATTTAVGTPAAVAQRASSDCWAWGYCYDRLKRAKLEHLDLDGINTLSTSGSQIVVQIGTAPTGDSSALTLTGILRYTRILKLHGGATQILG